MKAMFLAGFAALVLAGPPPALAMRDVGDLPVRQARSASDTGGPATSDPRTGVVTAVRAVSSPRGVEIEIDGRWWLVLRGRTSVLRDGRLLDESALAAGQAVRYAPASAQRGERALDFVEAR